MDPCPQDVEQLEELLSRPNAAVVELFAKLPGDLIFLGVGGKMGPTMARMAKRASIEAGVDRRVMGVSRFSSAAARDKLRAWGIETISCDLLQEQAVANLPNAENVISMSGFKFGTAAEPSMTWAVNCLASANICNRYRESRIVAFSTGNVYGYVPIDGHGAVETDTLNPVGEYAMAAVGRERIYDYFSRRYETPMAILRLNYATELRYGVLVDLAQQVLSGTAIDISMGHVNVIWLADANAMTLAALAHCQTPAHVINLAGDEILRTRDICQQVADQAGLPIQFVGSESDQALLNDGRNAYQLLGRPAVQAPQMIRWTTDWLLQAGPTLDKPTHFEVLDGKF